MSNDPYSNMNNYMMEDNPFLPTTDSARIPLTSSVTTTSSDTPAWLREAVEVKKQDNFSEPQKVLVQAPIEVDQAVPRMILYTRVINLGLSICMIFVSLLSLLTTNNATTGVLACYVVVFSCLLCCFETHLKQISKIIAFNFGFLYSAKSRSAFMIFVGTILFSFSLFGKIIGCLMLANAAFNIFIIAKYPGYEDAQRQDAQSEIKDYLAANPAFANNLVTGGLSFLSQANTTSTNNNSSQSFSV